MSGDGVTELTPPSHLSFSLSVFLFFLSFSLSLSVWLGQTHYNSQMSQRKEGNYSQEMKTLGRGNKK